MSNTRSNFESYIKTKYPRLKYPHIVVSDAFYPDRHNLKITINDLVSRKRELSEYQDILYRHFQKINRKTPKSDAATYTNAMKYLLEFLGARDIQYVDKKTKSRAKVKKVSFEIPRPSIVEVEKYLKLWDRLENYTLQEKALNKLFHETYPHNTDIEDVLVKVCTLNDFYSTNIFKPFVVAKHIVRLNIDSRLLVSDPTLVHDIATVVMGNGNKKYLYSFATKYCSHHKPLDYPIFDNYVYKVLIHFNKLYRFADFEKEDIKDYSEFIRIFTEFQTYFGLEKYSKKDIDRYLWQVGKEHFKR